MAVQCKYLGIDEIDYIIDPYPWGNGKSDFSVVYKNHNIDYGLLESWLFDLMREDADAGIYIPSSDTNLAQNGQCLTEWAQQNKETVLECLNFIYRKDEIDLRHYINQHWDDNVLDVSNFDTSKITNMSGLFESCLNKEIIGLETWDVSNVVNMAALFSCCENLTRLDLSSWNTNSVKDMTAMFVACESIGYLDISSFDVEETVPTSDMFAGCDNLHSLKAPKELVGKPDNGLTNEQRRFILSENVAQKTFQPKGLELKQQAKAQVSVGIYER